MNRFRSSDFVFRHTAVGAAFAKMGLVNIPMAREPLFSGLLRDTRYDIKDKKGRIVGNMHPSREVHIHLREEKEALDLL